MPKYSKLMCAYGVFLIVCGFLGWAATGFTGKGATAIASGGVSGALMLVMGWLSSSDGRAAKNIGIHLGFILALLFGGVFTWRALAGWGLIGSGEPKPWVALLISVMAVASFATFAALLAMRPKPEQRGVAGPA
jgi:4-hydroxybenzoate polyprenyltransferase